MQAISCCRKLAIFIASTHLISIQVFSYMIVCLFCCCIVTIEYLHVLPAQTFTGSAVNFSHW